MAKKKVSPNTGYSEIHYNIETRQLRFYDHLGNVFVYHGIPGELFYGMPSGPNVQNFIDLKLRGRFEVHVEAAKPLVEYNLLAKELRVYIGDERWIWNVLDGQRVNIPPGNQDAWLWFLTHYGTSKKPDRRESFAAERQSTLPLPAASSDAASTAVGLS